MRVLIISFVISLFSWASGNVLPLSGDSRGTKLETSLEPLTETTTFKEAESKGYQQDNTSVGVAKVEDASNKIIQLGHEFIDLLKDISNSLKHSIFGTFGAGDTKDDSKGELPPSRVKRETRGLDIFQRAAKIINGSFIPRFIKALILPVLKQFHNFWKFVKFIPIFLLKLIRTAKYEEIDFIDLGLSLF